MGSNLNFIVVFRKALVFVIAVGLIFHVGDLHRFIKNWHLPHAFNVLFQWSIKLDESLLFVVRSLWITVNNGPIYKLTRLLAEILLVGLEMPFLFPTLECITFVSRQFMYVYFLHFEPFSLASLCNTSSLFHFTMFQQSKLWLSQKKRWS